MQNKEAPKTKKSSNTCLWVIIIVLVLIIGGGICVFVGGAGMYWFINRVEDGEQVNNDLTDIFTYDQDTTDSTSSTTTTLPQQPQTPKTGKITGEVGYPSEYFPTQIVCAENINTYEVKCSPPVIGTLKPGYTDNTYELVVPVGSYHVYAEVVDTDDPNYGEVVYYTEFVTCGMAVGCTSHAKITVTVAANQVHTDIDPIDWYE
jgi:hypothetical protein